MSSSGCVSLCAGVVIALILVFVPDNGNAGMGKHPDLKCLGESINLTKYFHGFMECAGKMMDSEDMKKMTDPATSAADRKQLGMKAHKNMCIRVCQWKTVQHLLTDDNKINDTGSDAFIDSIFPEAARAGLKTGSTKCFTDNSKTFSDADNCAGFSGFEKCIKNVYKDVCKMERIEMDEME